MNVPLSGRYALITGGGSGIGLACALQLAADGASVTIMGRTPEKLERAVKLVEERAVNGAVATSYCGDATDEDTVRSAVSTAAGPDGALDIAISSHGMGMIGPLMQMDKAVWDMMIDTNLTGTFLVTKHAAAAMARSGGGSIVAVSSIAADVSHRYMSAYAASKHGIDGFVESAAAELGRYGVRVNAVRPGYVPGTDLTGAIPDPDAFEADCLAQVPLGRLGTPEDVAHGVRYLAGDESSWVTGTCISINGGQHLMRSPDYDLLSRQIFGDDYVDTIPGRPDA